MPRGRPRVERVKVKCFNCDAEIEKYASQVRLNKTGRFFCSTACLDKVGRKPRRRKERKCEQCGEQFYPRHGKDDPARFCSKACFDKWQGRNGKTFECEVCGDGFRLPPGLGNRTGRFCSRSCESQGRIKRRLDRKHNGKPALVDFHGYVRVYEPDHPGTYKNGWMFEHRLVAERELGRRLAADDHVHHINGNKQDNRPKNLAVMTQLEHAAITGRDTQKRLREWQEYRRRYGPLET